MKPRHLALTGIGLSLMLLNIGCSKSTQPSPERLFLQGPPPPAGYTRVRVGLATIYPPLAFKENGQIKGVEADLAGLLATDSALDIRIIETPWEEVIPALEEGRIDVIMSGMSITEERKQLVSFTEPYMRVGQMCLIRAADIAHLAEPSVLLSGRWRIGFINNTTGEFFAREKLPRSEKFGFDSIEQGVAALHSKKIDYFIHDAPTIWRLTTDPAYQDDSLLGLFSPLTEEYLAWAVRKSDTALGDFLSAKISQWKADGRLQDVLDRWIRLRVELRPPHLSQPELGTIR